MLRFKFAAVAAGVVLSMSAAAHAASFSFSGTLTTPAVSGPDGATIAADLGISTPLNWSLQMTFLDPGPAWVANSWSLQLGDQSFSSVDPVAGFGIVQKEGVHTYFLVGLYDDFAPSLADDEIAQFVVLFEGPAAGFVPSSDVDFYLHRDHIAQLVVFHDYGLPDMSFATYFSIESRVASAAVDGELRVRTDLSIAPEPGTWALMILGFSGVGGMLRRRATHAT